MREPRPVGVCATMTAGAGSGRPVWVVTGITGRVGRMLSAIWATRPPDAAGIVGQVRGGASAAGLHTLDWAPLDGLGPLVAFASRTGSPDVMIALAGVTPGPGKRLDDNAALAEATLSAAQGAGIGRVLVASSSAVYGAGGTGNFHESDDPQPVNEYGCEKRAMERVCDPWRARGLEVCCLRIGNVAGADALLGGAGSTRGANPLTIDRFADGGGPVRSYIGPGTLARVLATLAGSSAPLPAAINVAAPRPVAMTALADAAGLPWVWTPAPPTAHRAITLDCARLAALHLFTAADSDPAAMVAQWRKAGGGR